MLLRAFALLAHLSRGYLEPAPIVIVWAWHESAWRNLVGDAGRSCGVLQLGNVARAGYTCAEVLADRKLSIRLWLTALRLLEEKCGSRTKALGALASGKCGGAPALVAFRLHEAGE